MIKIGLIGKTNTGKTTFFNAATLASEEVSNYPFTTKQPTTGIAEVQAYCVCKDMGVKDNPKNSRCIDGWRFIPIELIDLPGLIKGSWEGKGLGMQFLNVASQADALLHIVDASGSIDAEGKITKPGMGNAVLDVYDIEEELAMWFTKIIENNLKRIMAASEKKHVTLDQAIHETLAGLKVKLEHVSKALEETELAEKNIKRWSTQDFKNFARKIKEHSKPTIIIANKMDLGFSEKNFEKLRDEFRDTFVIPACGEAELALRRAEQKGFIRYLPGEEAFRVIDNSKLSKDQLWALNYVEQRVFSKWIRTGVQFALNMCVFKLLRMNTVYPVEDATKFADKRGNILPGVFLVPSNATVKDVAAQIHSELAETMLYGIDVRTGLRLPVDYTVRDRDVIKIVAAARKK